MPSFKSPSSGAPPSADSRRTSMRRLSSIASLHVLNPFHRRRSHNASDLSQASNSSNVSLQASSSVTTVTPSNSTSQKPSASSFQTLSDLSPLVDTAPPISQANYLRRSSYICLPDDPIGGMPRSRTFSALPLPTRSKKTSPRTPSVSHSRTASGLVPGTRLPTPPASTRRHISGSLPATLVRAQNARNRLKTSDTMPLLPLNVDHAHNVQRPATSKESISMGPARAVQDALFFDEPKSSFSLPPGAYLEDHDWEPDTLTALPRHPSFCGSLPLTRYTGDENARVAHAAQAPVDLSSPTYHAEKSRLPLGASFARPPLAQRWNSQPVLTNATNVFPTRISSIAPSRTASIRRHEIRETRLLSARGAPTPPPIISSASSTNLLGTTSLRNSVGSFSHLRQPSCASLLNGRSSPPQPLTAHHVTTAEPTSYWAGRMSGLLDRYRNEELDSSRSSSAHHHIASNSLSGRPKVETDKLNTAAATSARMRKALEHLSVHCVTEEARESFNKFQLQYAAVQNLPELSRPIKRDSVVKVAAHARKKSEEGFGGKGAGMRRSFGRSLGKAITGDSSGEAKENDGRDGTRKPSLFERVLGRREKRESLG